MAEDKKTPLVVGVICGNEIISLGTKTRNDRGGGSIHHRGDFNERRERVAAAPGRR
ncbi:hypothetical protein TcasGA2_TC007065 [Tribolium castaneum]|uniref:Uncharacterized protein n=1 Tax=Tribolium castaneum TaxID=7070 RepID=D2A1Q8_TRICA|nr:hypothetical protein TcasGA2_TC007065 [Tribolium castaneum]